MADIVRLSTQHKETRFARARVATLFVVLAEKCEASTFTEEAEVLVFLSVTVHLWNTSASRATKSSCHPVSAYPYCEDIP